MEIFSGTYDIPPENALNIINGVIEKLTTYLCAGAGSGPGQRRYQPETFIYPGFSELPGITAPMDTPMHLTLILGNRCNFNCIYCYADLSSPSLSLSGSEAVGLIDDAAEIGVVSVCLTGGEPLLHPEIDKIVAAATGRGMLVVLATNASLLDERMADRLLGAGLKSIQVSLDAPSASLHHFMTGSKNTFDRVVAGIRTLKARGFRVAVRSVAMLHNWNAMPDLIDVMCGLNVDQIAVTTQVSCSGNCNGAKASLLGKMELDFLKETIGAKRTEYPGCEMSFIQGDLEWRVREDIIPCGGPMSTLVVHPSGEVTICEMMGDDPEISIGNIRNSGIEAVWLGQRHLSLLKKITNAEVVDPVCTRCESLAHCRTGCYNLSKIVYGDYYRKDPRCPGAEGLKWAGTPDF